MPSRSDVPDQGPAASASLAILSSLEADLFHDDQTVRRHALVTLGSLLRDREVDREQASALLLAGARDHPDRAQEFLRAWCNALGTPSCIAFAGSVLHEANTAEGRWAALFYLRACGIGNDAVLDAVTEILANEWDRWARDAFVSLNDEAHQLGREVAFAWMMAVQDYASHHERALAEFRALPPSPDRDTLIGLLQPPFAPGSDP